jgi:hypothetical protein
MPTAVFACNQQKPNVFKALARLGRMYQQSYPQKTRISRQTSKNQALGIETARTILQHGTGLPQKPASPSP